MGEVTGETQLVTNGKTMEIPENEELLMVHGLEKL